MATMTVGTGFFCPICGVQATVETTGIFGGILKQMLISTVLDRLNKVGGKLRSDACGHTWTVTTGSRKALRHV